MNQWDNLSDDELRAIATGQAAGMDLNGLHPQSDRGFADDLGVPVLGQADIDRLMGVPQQPQQPMFDDMSDEELMAIASEGQAPAPQVNPLQAAFEQKKNPNFFQRVGEDYTKRDANLQKAQNEYIYGDRGLPRTALRVGGDIAGFAGDVGGEALKSVGTGINNITFGGAGKLGNLALNSIAASPVGDALRYTSGQYGAFEKAYPEAARDISSAGNILGAAATFTPVKGGVSAANLATEKAIVPAAKLASQGTEKAITSLATPKMVMPNSEQLAQLGVKSYEAARKSGEVFDPKTVTNKFVGAIDSAKPSKIGGTVETELSKDLESALGKYKELAGRPLSIDEVDIIDKDLGNLKDQAYSAGKNQFASKLASIQNSLRGSVSESPSGKTLSEARDMFRRKYQMEDVERIFRNAEGRPNEAAIIQTGYRNLANQARQPGSGYTKEQIKLMDRAAKGGLSIDALKLASSKLIPIAAGASGGPVGAVGAYMGNIAAAAGATALQTAKANKLAKSITNGLSVPAEPTVVNRLASKLQKADMQKAFEEKKAAGQLLLPSPERMSAVPMTEAQIRQAQRKLNTNTPPVETPSKLYGLTPSQATKSGRGPLEKVKSLPRSEYLNEPSVPTVDQLKKFSRVETVPLNSARSHQSNMRWDDFEKGKYSEELLSGFKDKPVAIKLENGEYIIVDGNHRTVSAINSGKGSMEMTVIDARKFDPENAGRAKAKDNTDTDALMRQLLGE